MPDDVSQAETTERFSAFGPGNVSFFPGMKVYEVQ